MTGFIEVRGIVNKDGTISYGEFTQYDQEFGKDSAVNLIVTQILELMSKCWTIIMECAEIYASELTERNQKGFPIFLLVSETLVLQQKYT